MWFSLPVTVQNLMRDVRMWEKSFSKCLKRVFMEDEYLCLFIHSPTLWVLLIDQIGTDSESPSAGHLWVESVYMLLRRFLLNALVWIFFFNNSLLILILDLKCLFIYHLLTLVSLGEGNKGALCQLALSNIAGYVCLREVVLDDVQGPSSPFLVLSWRHQTVGHSTAVLSIVAKRTQGKT